MTFKSGTFPIPRLALSAPHPQEADRAIQASQGGDQGGEAQFQSILQTKSLRVTKTTTADTK